MAVFDDALGRGPEGPSYVPPRTRRRTPTDKVKAWAWYRWGVGHRPQPRYEDARHRVADDQQG